VTAGIFHSSPKRLIGIAEARMLRQPAGLGMRRHSGDRLISISPVRSVAQARKFHPIRSSP
jgi:hypothetical protein